MVLDKIYFIAYKDKLVDWYITREKAEDSIDRAVPRLKAMFTLMDAPESVLVNAGKDWKIVEYKLTPNS